MWLINVYNYVSNGKGEGEGEGEGYGNPPFFLSRVFGATFFNLFYS